MGTPLVLMSGEAAAFIGGALCFGVFFLWLIVTSIIDARRRRSKVKGYKSIDVVPIEKLADQQEARVVGVAQASDAVLEAPISGRACVCYQASIYKRGVSGKNWNLVASEARCVRSFSVLGEREQIVVEPDEPKVIFNPDVGTHSGTFIDPTERQRAFAERLGAKTKAWVFNKQLLYREAAIEVGQTVEVYGKCVLEGASASTKQAGYRDGQWRKRLVAPSDGPMVILDGPESVNLVQNPENASVSLPTGKS